jgi:hypothetical protein
MGGMFRKLEAERFALVLHTLREVGAIMDINKLMRLSVHPVWADKSAVIGINLRHEERQEAG